MRTACALGALLVLLVAFPARGESSEHDGMLDTVNRGTRTFNFWMLDYAFEPVARGYNWVMPKWGQERIRNVLLNLERPRDFVNSLAQGKFRRAGHHLSALVIDSTVGLAGLFDLSGRWIGIEPPETTGETLGFYRIPAGTYLVFPIFGGTCPRCIVGFVADSLLHPLFWLTRGGPVVVGVAVTATDNLNTLARVMPSPFADETSWEAYEVRFNERPPYPEAKQLFFENLELDVAE